ncbi:unnamed protein product [Xylocopa violacea]|uniref:Uncharacterized protein n=1 Tax=Xylocopa violacea TaxID=135666 RepID=A0ABP1PK50_XYLVO
MWDLRNRGVIVLVSALSGCVFLYNVFGPIFILTVSLFFTIYACYSLIINDSLLSRHAFLLFDYCKYVSFEVYANSEIIVEHAYQYICQFFDVLSRRFRKRYPIETQSGMEKHRGSHYQLSSDPYPIRRNSSNFGSIAQFSPIPRNSSKANISNDISSNVNFYHNSGHSPYDHSSSATKHTSTPMFPSGKEGLENQTFDSSSGDPTLPKGASFLYGRSHAALPKENATYFNAEHSSQWGCCVDSKLDAKAGEPKVAGPLSTSTRHNIDPKVYNDVTSPGLTTRLTKYAAEANNKLTHQSQYRVGQFPKVNLHASPVPVINAKSVKTRTPVTVRVAPPRTIRYSPPSRQNILTNLCYLDNDCTSSNDSAHALREISLKRHASRDDVTSDLAKKQRTDALASRKFEIPDETKQKRSREESLKSEEDISPQSKAVRPIKRTKTPSCYDIINSLSSSKHVVSGVKRKARDFSRSGTPDFEKHFKSLESVQTADPRTVSPQVSSAASPRRYDRQPDACYYVDKLQEHSPLKGILKTKNRHSGNGNSEEKRIDGNHSNGEKNRPAESTKLTHKLFMKAEPERNEKLRMLVEEQGNIRAKFTTDDVEEIKKEDIADMRQTSMKARLQSMFDAISGKATSQINPDVVIQAEEVNVVKSVASPVMCATLNSSTTTTNVNTTPISTSAVAPSPGTGESVVKSPKHVAFNLPTKETSSSANNTQFRNTGPSFERKTESASTTVLDNTTTTAQSSTVSRPEHAAVSSTSSSNVQNSDFGKSTSNTLATSSLSTHTTSNKQQQPPLLVPATMNNIFGSVATVVSTTLPVSTSPSVATNTGKNISQDTKIATTRSSTLPAASGGSMTFASSNTMVVTDNKNEKNANAMPFNSDNTTSARIAVTTANTSAPLFTFGNKIGNATTNSKSEGFVFNSVGNTSTQTSGSFGCSSINNVGTNGSNNRVASTVTTSPAFSFRPAATSSTFSFGTASVTTGNAAATSLFAIGNNNSSTRTCTATQFPTSNSSIFASSSSGPSLIFGATTTSNQQPIFGTTSSLSSSSGFASTNAVPIFSNTNSASVPVFGSNVSTPASVVPSSGTNNAALFSPCSNSTTTSASTFPTTTNIFGQASSSSITSFKSSSGVFGTNNSSTLFGSQTTTPSTFGSSNVSNNSQIASAFNATNVSMDNTSVPGFAASGTAVSGFRSQNQEKENPAGGQGGSGSQNLAVGSSIFGGENTAVTVFGASNPTSSGPFNSASASSSNMFTGQNTTPSSNTAFGAATTGSNPTNCPPAFGDTNKISPFGAQPSAFGHPVSNASTSVFGNANASNENNNNSNTTANSNTNNNNNNNNNSNTTGIFTFGSNQKPSQQSTASFSFGTNSITNNNVAASTSASTPFQFGAITSNSATGFNFSAPSTTPSVNFGATSSTATFNASTPGMFSIGSGSIAPRSRNIRTRKQR